MCQMPNACTVVLENNSVIHLAGYFKQMVKNRTFHALNWTSHRKKYIYKIPSLSNSEK